MADSTRIWLKKVLAPYKNKGRTFTDTDAVLQEFKGLQPKTDTYTFEDGKKQVLLNLHGTLQILFRSAQYNIPVAIWVPMNFPEQGPMCYVTPTSTMLVKAGKHVDANGRVYHPQLAHWTPNSTLCSFLRVLQQIFSAEPPVYAKPQGPSPISGGPSRPAPSIPGQGSRSSFSQSPGGQLPPGSQQPRPPIPQHPSRSSPTQMSGSPDTRNSLLAPSPRPLGPGTALPPAYTSTDQLALNAPFETPAQKKELLLRTLSEKIAKKSNDLAVQLSRSVESHLQTHRKLTENNHRAQKMLKLFDEESIKMQKNLTALEAHTLEMGEALGRIQAMPDVDVDSLGTQQSIPVNQIFEAVADDRAIDDALYHFVKTFTSDNGMDLSTFIKTVRTMAREQFLRRVLVKKIRKYLGLKAV